MSILNITSNTDKLDSDLLRTFIAISNTGSFTKGADRIYRSQSAVSLQIKRLEEILGQRVFERRSRGVLLTPTGEKLRPIAQRIINTLDTTIGELRVGALTGSIRIGIPDEYGETILPEVIAVFARKHPQIEIEVHCGFSANFPKALARHEIDLAVYAVELPINKGMSLLRKEVTQWVTSKNHLAHEQDPIPVALFDRDCWWRDRALEALEKSGRRYRVVYTSESVMGVMAAISAGVAVGLLSESTLRDDLNNLTRAHGFPKMPQSALVLDCRGNTKTSLSQAMAAVIKQSFK
jgi:DNA-binding transcriptional LysR family regulator